MYATVRTYRADPAQMDELLHILDQDFVPQISERPGLCGYQAIDSGDGTLVDGELLHEPRGGRGLDADGRRVHPAKLLRLRDRAHRRHARAR